MKRTKLIMRIIIKFNHYIQTIAIIKPTSN